MFMSVKISPMQNYVLVTMNDYFPISKFAIFVKIAPMQNVVTKRDWFHEFKMVIFVKII